MMIAKLTYRVLSALLAVGAILLPVANASVEDGLGTNHVLRLRANSLQIATEVWTNLPPRVYTEGGGPLDFRTHSNTVFWTPLVYTNGLLKTARVQTDEGTAEINIVRAKWNDTWGTYTVVGAFQASGAGTASTTWSSSWLSNGYRIGIVATNFTTGTNLWWSVEYTQ